MPAGPSSDATTVVVGEITGVHGLRGLLRVRTGQPNPPSLVPGSVVMLDHRGSRRDVRVLSATMHGPALLIGLDGVADRSAAEALRGGRFLVERSTLPDPGPDEFYDFEVIGFAAETTAGRPLGTIAETMSNGLHDVWTLRDGDREWLVPVVAAVVRDIDRAGRRVVIEPMPGLLDD
jgi:16S rRNA processing protein RimM